LRPALIALLALLPAQIATAAIQWTSHSDASAIADLCLGGNQLWAVGRGGATIVDLISGEKTFLRAPDGLAGNELNCVLALSEEEIWLGSAGTGLIRYRPDDAAPWLRLQRLPQGLAGNDIRALVQDPQGRIWYGAAMGEEEGGFGVIENGAPGAIWATPEGLGDLNVNALAFAADTLYVGTDAGLYALSPEWDLSLLEEAPTGAIDDIVVADGRIWLLTEGQLHFRASGGGVWTRLFMPAGAGYPTALAAAEDRLVVAVRSSSLGTSVHRYAVAELAWESLSDGMPDLGWPPDYAHPVMGALAAAPDGEVWMGGEIYRGLGPGLLHRENGDWTLDPLDQGPMGPDTKALGFGPSGRLWTASDAGAASEEDGLWTRRRRLSAYGNAPAWSLAVLEDGDGWVWFCPYLSTHPTPFIRMRADTGELDPQVIGPGGIPTSHLVSMAEDAEGGRWFATDDAGLALCDAADQWWLFNSDPDQGGLPSSFVNAVAPLPNGRIALLCSGAGLCVWDRDASHFWKISATSTDSTVYDPGGELALDTSGGSLAVTAAGEIWVGQLDGLVKVAPAGRGYLVQGKLGQAGPDEPGLISRQVKDLAAAPDGSVWAATELGLAHLDLDLEAGAWVIENFGNARALAEADPEGLFLGPDQLAPLPDLSYDRIALSPDGRRIVAGGRTSGLVELAITDDPPPDPDEFSRIRLYPNPVRLSLGHSRVDFTGVEFPVDVRIYNLEGQLVRELHDVQPGEPVWPDLGTRFGSRAVSGIYLVHLSYEGRTELRTLALIR